MKSLVSVLLVLDVQDACGVIVTAQCRMTYVEIAELPIDKNINIQEMNKRRLYAKTKTFSIFKSMFKSIVYKLEMEYWVLHCGTDGYLYLLF